MKAAALCFNVLSATNIEMLIKLRALPSLIFKSAFIVPYR